MSRVDRNKDQYSKADRQAIENSRAARNAGAEDSAAGRSASSADQAGVAGRSARSAGQAGAAGRSASSADQAGAAGRSAGAADQAGAMGRVASSAGQGLSRYEASQAGAGGARPVEQAPQRRAGRAERNAAEEDRIRREVAAEERAAARRGRSAANTDEDLGIWDQTEEEKKKARREARKMGDGRPEFHGGRLVGRFLSFIGTLLLIAAIVACLGLTVPRFVGIGQYVVISGSMEPAIPVGSMVYSAQTDPSTLEEGDIIVFLSNESGSTPITHRVVENRIADGEVITKGDANEQNDLSPVIYTNILGKVELTVPMLGFIASPLGTLMGKIAMGCVIVAAYLLTVVGRSLRRK